MASSLTSLLFSVLLVLLALCSVAEAFTARPIRQIQQISITSLFMSDEETKTVERGVSVDQDGKSNVWAIEPKMEVSSKSSEENTQSAVIAGVGLGVAAVVAVAVLTNLPDPNQF